MYNSNSFTKRFIKPRNHPFQKSHDPWKVLFLKIERCKNTFFGGSWVWQDNQKWSLRYNDLDYYLRLTEKWSKRISIVSYMGSWKRKNFVKEIKKKALWERTKRKEVVICKEESTIDMGGVKEVWFRTLWTFRDMSQSGSRDVIKRPTRVCQNTRFMRDTWLPGIDT